MPYPLIALDLALGLRMVWSAASVSHATLAQVVPELPRDVRRAVVAQQSRPVFDADLIDPGHRERQVERFGDIRRPHRRPPVYRSGGPGFFAARRLGGVFVFRRRRPLNGP